MSFIEGIGDEVTIVGILLLILILLATVLSTGRISSSFNFITLPNLHVVLDQLFSDVHTVRGTGSEDSSAGSEAVISEDVNVQAGDSAEAESPATAPDEPAADAGSDSTDNNQITRNVSETEEAPEDGSDDYPPEEEQPSAAEQQTPPNMIRVRLKYLNDTERTVLTSPTVKVKEFKRNHFEDDISNHRTVRLIFNGRLLLDNKTITESNINDGTVIHVHISSATAPQPAGGTANSSLDISNLFMPLFAVMLGICWLSYLHYPQYFNIASVVLLIVFSLSFLIACTHSSIEAS